MATVAGLVLGVLPLIVPAFKGYQRCSELFRDIRNHSAGLKYYTGTFLVQKALFELECKHILKTLVGEEEALEMLKDMDHPQWRSSDFVDCLLDSVEAAQREALELTITTLQDVENVLRRVKKAFDASHKGGSENSSSPSNSSTQQQISTLKGLGTRFDWALSGKSEVIESLEVLRKQTQDLRTLREEKFRSQNTASSTESSKLPHKSKGPTRKNSGFEILAIREFAQKLYEGVRPAVCGCQVNLRLETSRQALLVGTKANFRLVVTPGHDSAHASCACLLITTEKDAGNNDSQGTTCTVTMPSSASAKGGMKRRRESQNLGSVVKRVMFSFVDHASSGNQCSQLNSLDPPILITCNSPQSWKTPCKEMIAKLCAWPEIPPVQTCSTTRDPLFLGLLGNAYGRTYKHSVYREQHSFPTSNRMSLSQVLCHGDKHHLIPRQERVRLALVLAAATLQYGSFSASWFQEHWRSRDIFFFFDRQKQLQQELCTMDPYVVAPFKRNQTASAGVHVSPAKNNQLFSLAIVLTEIAFGKLLQNIRGRKRIDGPPSDIIWEYLKLREILQSKTLAREIGRKYAKVVEKCMGGDFGDGDLDTREVQDSFYTNVVKVLEECLRSFEED